LESDLSADRHLSRAAHYYTDRRPLLHVSDHNARRPLTQMIISLLSMTNANNAPTYRQPTRPTSLLDDNLRSLITPALDDRAHLQLYRVYFRLLWGSSESYFQM